MAEEQQTISQEETSTEQTASIPEATLSLTDEIQLSSDDFNINKALTNNLVGYTLNGVQHTGTLKKTTNKGYTKTGGTIYSVTDNGLELLFDEEGKCLTSGYESVTLKNASASLPTFSGNKVLTRAGKETASINAIRPIDSFAESIIIGILQYLANPQEMSDADILKWCDVAYRWAQGMFAIASTYRTANDSDVNASSDSVKGAIENITKALNTMNTTVKDKDMGVKSDSTLNVKLTDTVNVGNPTDDKFQVDGAGGLSYDGLNDIGENISSFPAFNSKAIGRSSLANVAKKILATDTTLDWLRKLTDSTLWTTYASSIHSAIKSSIDSDIDAKLTQFAKDYNLTKS